MIKSTFYTLRISDIATFSYLIKASKTTIIGIAPKSLEMGMELSPEIEAKIPKVINIIMEEVGKSA